MLSDAIALKSKLSRLFDGGEPGLSDPPLDHPAFAVDQFQLAQANKIAHVIGAFGGALPGQLVVLAQEGRQLQGLEVMGQQHLRRIGQANTSHRPPSMYSARSGSAGASHH